MAEQNDHQDSPDTYRTLREQGAAETRVQRSRFLALAAPAADEEAARAVVAEMARRYHDSRHVCYGWRLGPPPSPTENRSDAGEPSGTAGEPILVEIRKRDLTMVVVVVVRYFGGVKLGTGGLARAYGEAAAAALDAAPQRVVRQGRRLRLEFPYAFRKTAARLLAAHDGETVDEQYGAAVVWEVWLPHSQWRGFCRAVSDTSAGRIEARPVA